MSTTATKPSIKDAAEGGDRWWWSGAMVALKTKARTGQTFDAYDLTRMGVSDPDQPNQWGALFQAASRARIIEYVRHEKSRRPTRAGGVCARWQGTDQYIKAQYEKDTTS